MKRTAILLCLISSFLAACQNATPTPVTAPTVAATQPATLTPEGKNLVNATYSGCVAQSPFPTPGPTEQSLFPPVSAKDWVKGPDSATVTFTEYSDFQ